MNVHDLALHTDKYQINMMYAHWFHGTENNRAVFEAFFRKRPFKNGFAVFAGLQRIVDYLSSLRFSEETLAYLAEQEENYDPKFLDALREFRFTGDLYCVKEGTIVFPNEPLIRVEARIFEAQLIETAVLNFMNYQTLIATKAARIKQVAPDDILLEFGTRRAQEADAAVWGARSAYIAGFHATSNVRAGMLFDIPAKGTHAHSWVQDHDSELESFERFAEALPNTVTLLVDTYDTLKSGVPNAIKVAKHMESQGKRMGGIRLDSGDLAYLSKQARQMLDEAGLPYVKIVASNDLDEHTILHLKSEGARIDTWGVGTQLITASDQPSLGGVYKLVAREQGGAYIPTIKISGNPEKITTPGFKTVYRIINRATGKAEADYIALTTETDVRNGDRIKLFDPVHTYIHKFVTDYEAQDLLQPIFVNGELLYELPTLGQIRDYHEEQKQLFWPEYLRLLNPELYPVDLSQEVWDMKMRLIHEHHQATDDKN
ncbi:nicotinate phosphoribosyltransferase [Tumebacillus permanentifrigoris]|uniref:Nicotinate phosphoribosyltransferase n=1 Tax=Tumebacillus permanentifrigoris TaxID=378543 RepID=A0A316DCK7_9BACL|nr:nicotinate phosphoribosyltransferase [Tumebacillus permanentifrigoris]PWK13045.1 nicotinate phosphoribosyltransferase [Tumebacillus permanentifrigoris]